MSEANTTPPAGAASLYPTDGGAGGTIQAAAGADTIAAAAGADTLTSGTGADTTTADGGLGLGTDTTTGAETAAGADSQAGTDSQTGTDSLTAASYDFKIPEGMSINEDRLTSLKDTLATAKVPTEVAQSLLDMHVEEMNAQATAFATQQKQAWDTTIEGWKKEINADPELGGDKRATTTANIARALDEYGDAKTRAAFELTGSGWNPDIIRFINKMASALSEGGIRAASGPSSQKATTLGASLYENDGKGPNAT